MHFTKDSLRVSEDSSHAEEMIKQYFSAMMDAEGYETVQKKYLTALKEIKMNRPGSMWFTLWLRGNVMVEGYTTPTDNSVTSHIENTVEILSACAAIPFNCGQVAYVTPQEDRVEDFGYIWSLTPGVSCAEVWKIAPNEEDSDRLDMESVTKEHFQSQEIEIANDFGGFITVYCVNIFEGENETVILDDDIKVFAQYLREQGHDLHFNFDKILAR